MGLVAGFVVMGLVAGFVVMGLVAGFVVMGLVAISLNGSLRAKNGTSKAVCSAAGERQRYDQKECRQ